MTLALVAVGGVGTIGGAAVLVAAFRAGQSGEGDQERRLFRWAVVLLAGGSVAFLGAVLTGG